MKAKILIEMPDGCGDCRFYGLTGWIGSCLALEQPFCFAQECDADNTDRLKACPLIPVEEESILKVLDDIDAIIKEGEGSKD